MLEDNSRIESENCQRSDSKERKQHDPRNRREPELQSSSLNRNRSSSLNRNRHSGEFSNYSRGIFIKWFSSFFYMTWKDISERHSLYSFPEANTIRYSQREKIINRVEFKQSLVWIFSVPFSLKRSSKCTIHVNVI